MEPHIDYGILDSAQQIYTNVVNELFQHRNVVACGLGYKITSGKPTGKLSLVVSVTQKMPASELASEDLIPQSVSGLETDVVETGRIRAQMAKDLRARWRPAQPGISIGHRDITAGTFGLLVQREGQAYILSNNHVLADINAAGIGDPIYQPGPADSGTSNDRIATLSDFEPINFGDAEPTCRIAETLAVGLNWIARITGSTHRLQPIQATPSLNLMDAALALPDQPDLVIPEVAGIGMPTGAAEPTLGQEVQKMGRTSGLTKGTVSQISVTVDVSYADRTARFTDQIFTTPMSSPGDSGSSILNMERQAVGLLFAGSERVSIFTPIQRVLNRFEVDVITV
jgi:hypothetical protein